MRRRYFLASTLLPLAACRRSQPTVSGLVFVANEEGRSVAVVDLGGFALLGQIALPGAPSVVLSHPRRAAVYVLTPASGTLHELDPQRRAVRRSLRLDHSLDGMRFSIEGSDPGEHLYLLSREARRLTRVSLRDLRPEATITLPDEPEHFHVASWHPYGVVSFGGQGTVGLLNLRQDTVGRVVRVAPAGPDGVGQVLFRSDGGQVLVANRQERALSILNASDGRLVTHLPLAVRPDRLCPSDDNGTLFVTGDGADAVVLVEPYLTQVAATLLAGHAPGPMAASPDYLYIANPPTGEVTVLGVTSRKVVAMVAVGRRPGAITVTPDGQFALVLNHGSGDMAVIRAGAIVPSRRKTAPLLTMIPVGGKPVGAAVRSLNA